MILDEVIKFLKSEYYIHTVVLYGSRAREDYRKNSDYDLFCVRRSGERIRKIFEFKNLKIDLIVENETIIEKPENILFLWSHKLLLDTTNFYSILNHSYENYIKLGTEKLEPNRLHQRQSNVLDLLSRLNEEEVNVVNLFKKHDLIVKLLPLFFAIRGEWYFGEIHAFKWLEKNDPEVYGLFEKALDFNAPLEDIEILAKKVICI